MEKVGNYGALSSTESKQLISDQAKFRRDNTKLGENASFLDTKSVKFVRIVVKLEEKP